MVLQIIHLIVLTAMLTCGLVVAFYARRIHATQSRELIFLDARDVGKRRYRSEARHVRQAWYAEIRTWLGDTGALLGKLSAIAEESSPEARDTPLTPPPTSLPSSSSLAQDTCPMPGRAPVSRERVSPDAQMPGAYPAIAPPASATVLPSEPARIAAGIGPRPRPAPARFPGTMLSMPSVREDREDREAPLRARPAVRVETKAICRECDGGFVAVGNGGISQCYACNGSGFIDAR
jgi:hypothetical protein